MTLAELKSGQSAVIDAVQTDKPGVIRLMILGLVEGVPVNCIGPAIGGDPIEFQVLGASISVRKEQARHFGIGQLSAVKSAPAL